VVGLLEDWPRGKDCSLEVRCLPLRNYLLQKNWLLKEQ
jgi:hypothetical protein